MIEKKELVEEEEQLEIEVEKEIKDV